MLLLELLSVTIGQAREIENNTASDHGDLISDSPKEKTKT